jgi:hypothetical protein
MIHDAETMVPRELMRGQTPEDIVAELVRLDWSPQAARALVTRVAEAAAGARILSRSNKVSLPLTNTLVGRT